MCESSPPSLRSIPLVVCSLCPYLHSRMKWVLDVSQADIGHFPVYRSQMYIWEVNFIFVCSDDLVRNKVVKQRENRTHLNQSLCHSVPQTTFLASGRSFELFGPNFLYLF